MKRVLITGVGRCGTLVISDSFGRIARHESVDEFRKVSRDRFDDRTGAHSRGFETSIGIFDSWYSKGHLIECSCFAWNCVDLIAERDTQIAFVNITRDKEPSVKSMLRTPLYMKGGWPFQERCMKGFRDFNESGYSQADRRFNCERVWDIRTEGIRKGLEAVPDHRQLTVDFVDMVNGDGWNEMKQFIGEWLKMDLGHMPLKNHPHRGNRKYWGPIE